MGPSAGASGLVLLGEYAVKSTIVLVLALTAARIAAAKTASFRHFVLSLALLSLLLLPLVSLAPFGWETKALPRGAVESARTMDRRPSVLPDRGAAVVSAGEMDAEVGGEAGLRPKAAPGSGRLLIPAVWTVGAAFILFRLAAGLLGARRLTREGETVADPVWRVLMQRFLAAVGLRRTVRLKSHREVDIPLTWGLLRPVILIPSDHNRWTDDQRSSALFHELSHIKRADFLVMILVRLSLAAFWFNPLSWIVLARIRKEQEKACDDLVLRAGLKPSTYAANLLLFKRGAGFRWDPSAALLGLFGGSSFNERLVSILRQRLAFKEVTMKTKLMLIAVVALAVACVGTARPVSAPAQTVPPAPAAVAAPAAPAAPAQEAKAAVQEKQAEKQKEQKVEEKKPGEKKIDVVVKTATEAIPLEITIVQGDQTKTIRLSDSWTLKDGPEGKVLILTPGGKELKLSEGGPIRIEIKGDKLEMISEPDKIGKKIIVYGNPEVDVFKLKEDAAKLRDEIRKTIVIEGYAGKLKDEIRKKIAIEIDAAKIAALTDKATALTEKGAKLAVEIDAEKLKALAEKNAVVVLESGKMKDEIKKATGLALAQAKEAKAQAVIVRENDAAIREQAKRIREMLTEVKEKKRDFADLEKAMEKLEAELEKKPVGEFKIVRPGVAWSVTKPDVRTEVRTLVKPEVVTIIREKEGGTTEMAARPRLAAETGANVITIKTTEEGGAMTVVAVSGKGKSREAYDRAVAELKKGLPEGMTLEPKFDEESGIITLTVKGAGKTGVPEDLVKKIAAALKEE